jgi:hypothetical protein
VFFLAAEPLTDKITWQNGNRYTFRLRPNTYMQSAMLVPEAAKLQKKTLGRRLPELRVRPVGGGDLQGDAEEAAARRRVPARPGDAARPHRGRRGGAGARRRQPDAIFNVLFGADLSKFVREGNTRGLFKGREVVSLLTGEPEYIEPLREEAPVGWIVTGYPYYGIQTDEHKKFFLAYYRKYNEYPKLGSVVGYSTIISIAEGIRKAKSTDTEKLIAAFSGLTFMSPLGKVTVPRDRPPVDDGRLPRQDQARGQQGRDDRLRLHRRRQGHAERRRGEEAPRDRSDPRADVVVSAVVLQVLTGLASASRALPRRERAVADLRRHPRRQLRARLVLHARAVRGGLVRRALRRRRRRARLVGRRAARRARVAAASAR